MQRKLLELAWGDLRTAKWNLAESDNCAMRYAAYHTQQAAEKMLKVCLKELGVEYSETYIIMSLLNKFPSNQKFLTEYQIDWLKTNASTLTEW